MAEKPVRKLSIIASKGSLDMAYPPLILANAARMSGVEVNVIGIWTKNIKGNIFTNRTDFIVI